MRYYLINLFFISILFSSCESDDVKPTPVVAGFENTSLSLGLDQNELTVNIVLSTAVNQDTEVQIDVTDGQGTENGVDYTTEPGIVDGQLMLSVPNGSSSASFIINKLQNPDFDEVKSMTFTLQAVGADGEIGTTNALSVTFEENPVSMGAVLEPSVGGEAQPNQVFVDLSTNSETVVQRDTWDFGFYSGTDFRVILNTTVGALARPLDKNDLNDVTSEDTVGFGAQLDLDAIFGAAIVPPPPPIFLSESASWTDNPEGNLNGNAIGAISSIAAENPVYIVNRGSDVEGNNRGWLKIRVLQSGSGYTLQFAEINAISFNEITIQKDNNFNFQFVEVENGLVSVQPESSNWDIAFTTNTGLLGLGPVITIPYSLRDVVIQNRNNVSIAEVPVEDEVTFESFSITDVDSNLLSAEINTIGTSWRTVASPTPGSVTAVSSDRFYVVNDTEGNLYKLRFTRLFDPVTEERGFPRIEYQLL